MALLHLSNQFMYHMTKWKLLSFLFHSSIYLFIFSPHGGEKRWRQKKKYKLEINCKMYFFPVLRFGNWWTCHKGLKEKKNEWLIRPSTDHLVLNIVVQWFNFTLAWKKGNMSRPRLYGQDFWVLASFSFYFFMDRDFGKNAKKRTRPTSSHFDLTLGQNAYEYILCRPIQFWQGKRVQKMHFRARNFSNA